VDFRTQVRPPKYPFTFPGLTACTPDRRFVDIWNCPIPILPWNIGNSPPPGGPPIPSQSYLPFHPPPPPHSREEYVPLSFRSVAFPAPPPSFLKSIPTLISSTLLLATHVTSAWPFHKVLKNPFPRRFKGDVQRRRFPADPLLFRVAYPIGRPSPP